MMHVVSVTREEPDTEDSPDLPSSGTGDNQEWTSGGIPCPVQENKDEDEGDEDKEDEDHHKVLQPTCGKDAGGAMCPDGLCCSRFGYW